MVLGVFAAVAVGRRCICSRILLGIVAMVLGVFAVVAVGIRCGCSRIILGSVTMVLGVCAVVAVMIPQPYSVRRGLRESVLA